MPRMGLGRLGASPFCPVAIAPLMRLTKSRNRNHKTNKMLKPEVARILHLNGLLFDAIDAVIESAKAHGVDPLEHANTVKYGIEMKLRLKTVEIFNELNGEPETWIARNQEGGKQ